MGFEYLYKFDKKMDLQTREVIIKEILKFPNIKVLKQDSNTLTLCWSYYKEFKHDIFLKIDESEIYTSFYSSEFFEQFFFIFMLKQLLRIYNIQCEFEEL